MKEFDCIDDSSNNNSVGVFDVCKEKANGLPLYVYCPEDDIDRVRETLERLGVTALINQYFIGELSGKTILHYKQAELDHNASEYLIKATEYGAWVEPLVSYLDNHLGYTEISLLHQGYFLHQKAFSILTHRSNRLIKRFIDLFFSFLLGVIALPVGILTAIAIKLESPGPVFYRQARTGLYNKQYEVIKFRSMRNDAEKNGAQWASQNDTRVTKVGNFIRKTRIDELPQLINVFKGEMSLVGPRPEREVFITDLEKEIPYYRFRHAVKPGITGLAQVKYPYGASVDDAIWKHKYDVFYIKHQSFYLDIKILLLTVKVVLFGMGR